MSRNKALISIITPVYNAEKYIHESIQSVIDQSYDRWELLIINDGSSDKSGEIIRSFDDPRIHYFKQDNKGVSAARNVGLQHMKGDYFCFLDADDILPENSLKARIEVFQSDLNIAFVDGMVLEFSNSLDDIHRIYQPNFFGPPLKNLVKLSEKCFLGSTWLVKRDHDFIYRMDERLTHSEDLDFYISLAHGNKNFYAFTTECILYYRRSKISSMNNIKGLEKGYLKLREKLLSVYHVDPIAYLNYALKVKKIIFLSYFRLNKDYKEAFLSLFR